MLVSSTARSLRVLVWILSVAGFLGASAVSPPAFAGTRAPLFHIERNKNANIVQYDAQVASDGRLEEKNPIDAYWVMKAEDGRRDDLTRLERQLAYGFTARLDESHTTAWLALVAYKERPIKVVRDNGVLRAEMQIAGRRAYLQKIYVQASSGALPRVEYVEAFGVDAKTGAPLRERKTP